LVVISCGYFKISHSTKIIKILKNKLLNILRIKENLSALIQPPHLLIPFLFSGCIREIEDSAKLIRYAHFFTNFLLNNLPITLLGCIMLVAIFSVPIYSIVHYCDEKVLCSHLRFIVAKSALRTKKYVLIFDYKM
jgi:hypothetical protein